MPATMLMATIVSVSSVVRIRSSSCGAVAAVESSGIRLSNYSAYHSECGDHRLQESALSFSPMVKARWADSSRIKGIHE